jgi:hypothetical protein
MISRPCVCVLTSIISLNWWTVMKLDIYDPLPDAFRKSCDTRGIAKLSTSVSLPSYIFFQVWFETFTTIECGEVFSGDQPSEDGVTTFRGRVCVHNQGLMTRRHVAFFTRISVSREHNLCMNTSGGLLIHHTKRRWLKQRQSPKYCFAYEFHLYTADSPRWTHCIFFLFILSYRLGFGAGGTLCILFPI